MAVPQNPSQRSVPGSPYKSPGLIICHASKRHLFDVGPYVFFFFLLFFSFFGLSCGSAGKESACNAGDLGLIPGLGRSPGEAKGYPLQYSGLENSMDCVVHRVAESRTRLSDSHFPSCFLEDLRTYLFLAVLGPHCCRWAASGCGKWVCSSLRWVSFSLQQLLLLCSTVVGVHGFSSCVAWACQGVGSYSMACGIFLDQR